MTPNERDDVVRWRPGRGGHVESFFLKLNDPASPRAVWLKLTLLERVGEGRASAQAEVWAIVFDETNRDEVPSSGVRVALKQTFSATDASFDATAGLRLAGAELRPGLTQGSVESGGHRVRWQLRFTTEGAPFRPLHYERFNAGPLPSFKLQSPYPDSVFDGEVEIDGVVWTIAGWPGMQGHNWGKRHTLRYAWAHCNQFEAAPHDTFFEGFSGRIKLGPLTTPFLTRTFLRVGGVNYPFWSVRAVVNRSVEVDYHRWAFVSRARDLQLEGEFVSRRESTAAIEYEDPDGAIAYCLNSKIARCELRLYRGGRLLHALHTPHGAALEVLVREPEHGLPIVVAAR